MNSGLFVLERVTDPVIEPVTLAEIRRQVRQFSDVTDDDDDLTALVKGAREWAEDFTGRALCDQTWRLTVGDYVSRFANVDSDTVIGYYRGPFYPRADGGILLRKSPAIAITSFVTVDSDGVETAIAASEYELREADSKWPRVFPLTGATWTNGATLRIVFRAGFAPGLGSPDPTPDVSLVPARFKQAIRLHAEAMYDRDDKVMQLYLTAAENSIRPEKSDLAMA
ncbi:MAG: hypothetical protein ACTS6J_01935 [Burkholderiales bacterium]